VPHDGPDRWADGDSDEALVAAAQAGDVRALEALLDRHQTRVLRLTRLLGVRPQDRDDVAQDVFLRVFRHLAGFRAGHSFAGWLYRVTVNVVRDHRAERGRLRERETAWAPAHDDLEAAGPAEDPHATAEERDLARALEEALDRLTERERAVFVLLEMEGRDTLEVARALGVTRVTVRRHLGLARRRLREILENRESRGGRV
jgi:RNA polymerase sigma-70 factor (ECF subfamily)